MGPSQLAELHPMVKQAKQAVAADPSDVRARVLLAGGYQTSYNYRLAIQQLQIAVSLDAEIGDPHLLLGDIYFELGMLDMVIRELYQQDPKGYLVFTPDSASKQILTEALEEYDLGLQRQKTLAFTRPGVNGQPGAELILTRGPEDVMRRIEQASHYLAASRFNKIVYHEDQARASIHMTLLLDNNPELRQTIQNLRSYRDSFGLFAPWKSKEESSLQELNEAIRLDSNNAQVYLEGGSTTPASTN